MNSKLVSIRNAFVAGLVLLAPLAVTWFVFSRLVAQVGGGFSPIFFFFVPDTYRDHPGLAVMWDILSTLLVIALITVLGFISRYVFTRFFVLSAERAVLSIPGIGAIYRAVKQIVDTFSSQKRALFTKVVLIQFPRPGAYALGFLTNKAKGEPQARTTDELWTVFVPTTPNPTSGFLILFPKQDIVEMDMSVGDAMKLIISGGAVAPPWPSPDSPASPAPGQPHFAAPTIMTTPPATPPFPPSPPS